MFNQAPHCPSWRQLEKYVDGHKIFLQDFVEYNNYFYTKTFDRRTVFNVDLGGECISYEVSSNYRDDNIIIVEDYIDVLNDNKEPGWWFTSKSDVLVFVSVFTRTMIMLPRNDTVMSRYHTIKRNCKMRYNKMWHKGGILKKASFRLLPLSEFEGLYSVYKKSKVKACTTMQV